MNTLSSSHLRKRAQLQYILAHEIDDMITSFKDEEEKMKSRQKRDFLRVLENASRRAIGRLKKCNCEKEYLCRHNKTASYNTRRPSKVVVQYRRNAKRLKQAGRAEESNIWEEKARQIDEKEQNK